MAETVGLEPTRDIAAPYWFSRPAPHPAGSPPIVTLPKFLSSLLSRGLIYAQKANCHGTLLPVYRTRHRKRKVFTREDVI